MNIGFDAKRAFFNRRGLGNYSRDTIRILSNECPEHNYTLYTPKLVKDVKKAISFSYNKENCQVVSPQGFYSFGPLSSLWRTRGICSTIEQDKIDIYHGLSHELPYGIEKTHAKSVVTMHDVIFLKNPELFPLFDRYSFRKKYTHGCHTADRVIAISEQTKSDLINYMGEKEERIDVVYQGCNPIFHQPISEEQMADAKSRYNLPSQFMLIVCAIERRKNHELILKAMRDPKVDIPLVIVGRSSEYQNHLQELIREYHLENRVLFLNEMPTEDLPVLYKLATLFVYPSLFEGFGIPILESLTVGTPVITSKGSCFEETGGKSARYVDCNDADELSETIVKVLSDSELQKQMVDEGFLHAARFSDAAIAKNLMDVYHKIV